MVKLFNFLEIIRSKPIGKAIISRGKLYDGGIASPFEWSFVENIDKIIPCAYYYAHLEFSPRNNCQVWRLKDVPGRTYIQIECFNYPEESLGCLGIGMNPIIYKGKHGVYPSRQAFEEFMDVTKEMKGFFVRIREQDDE